MIKSLDQGTEEGNDQESKQSNTTPNTRKHHEKIWLRLRSSSTSYLVFEKREFSSKSVHFHMLVCVLFDKINRQHASKLENKLFKAIFKMRIFNHHRTFFLLTIRFNLI